MKRHFYGIHLQSGKLSAAFDVIRYLSEPDSIRFSHITLRGPYNQPLSSYTLSELNHHKPREWCVRLDGAGAFIGGKQNTVIIRVDLLDLCDLFFKPDFREGTPHLTLYDGSEQAYANSLLRLLYRFDLTEIVFVSQLQKISPKAPTSGSFAIIYNDFYETFYKYLACEPSTEFVRSLDTDRKLETIEMILKQNFKELYDRLNTYPPSDQQLMLPFRNDDE